MLATAAGKPARAVFELTRSNAISRIGNTFETARETLLSTPLGMSASTVPLPSRLTPLDVLVLAVRGRVELRVVLTRF